jgi:hypothetical protein
MDDLPMAEANDDLFSDAYIEDSTYIDFEETLDEFEMPVLKSCSVYIVAGSQDSYGVYKVVEKCVSIDTFAQRVLFSKQGAFQTI